MELLNSVSELLNGLENVLPYVKLGAVGMGLALGLIAAAAFMYVVQTTFRPLLVVMQWMVAHTPGEKPGEIIQGFNIGARMLVWATLIGFVVWFVFH
jgi:hypothetical protein